MNVEWIKQTVRTSAFLVPTVSVVAAAASAVVTYRLTAMRLEKKYAEISDEEIRQAREMYAKRYKAEQFAEVPDYGASEVVVEEEAIEENAVALLVAAQEIAERQGYISYDKVGPKLAAQSEEEKVEVMVSQRRNAFDDQGIVETEEYDLSTELAKRDQGLPYIITDVVFYENEENKQQFTFAYYEEDDVLIDESDAPIDTAVIDRNLGLNNLRFGYGSSNKNTVLIHNPVSDNQYEVVRNVGSYARDMLGYDAAEEEYEDNRVRKFRQDD